MACRVEWSPEAVEDIEAIAAYIERDSHMYARAVVEKLLATARGLGDFPRMGRIVPEFGQDDLRERVVYSYRLIYRIDRERVLVVAVIHGRRLLEGLSQRIAAD
jgi:addiction module RelE/StbE family toxin